MERRNQCLEYSKKLAAKTEQALEHHPKHHMHFSLATSASGGDMASTTDTLNNNSMSSSYHNMLMTSNGEAENYGNSDKSEEAKVLGSFHNDVTSVLEVTKHSYSANTKRKSSKYVEVGSKLKSELAKYKKELKKYNTSTKDLEEKYLKINYELSEMQQKHDRFVTSRENTEAFSDLMSIGSEYSLQRKDVQVFNRESSFTSLPELAISRERLPLPSPKQPRPNKNPEKRHDLSPKVCEYDQAPDIKSLPKASSKRQQSKRISKTVNKNCSNKERSSTHDHKNVGLNDVFKVLKNVLGSNKVSEATATEEIDFKELQERINKLQNEQAQFRDLIQQQKSCLQDYQNRCIKAHKVMQTQQTEIDKLNNNNMQLEAQISQGIDQLRAKIDEKLRDISQLPQRVKEEQAKCEKVVKENNQLTEKVRALQNDSIDLRAKLEEVGRRKNATTNRLKVAERDLKIFKNYNTALKHEKQKLSEDLQKAKDQLDNVQNVSKRTLSRQREQSEKQRRDLQKRVFDLELKLSRSQTSTTSLIQERDTLISELQTQLNTLVHNFEVSQKHIRVLRRHIYSMSGGNAAPSKSQLFNEAA